jgi:hypothetical protein
MMRAVKTRVEYAIGSEPKLGTDDYGAFDYPGEMNHGAAIARAADDLHRIRAAELEDVVTVMFLVLRLSGPND